MENNNKKNFFQAIFGLDDDQNKDFWVPDDKAGTCFNCSKDFFGIFSRRHHCRICGNIFCKDCYTKFFEFNVSDQERELKVCEYCKKMYNKLNTILGESLIEYRDTNTNNKEFDTKLNDYCKNAISNEAKIKGFINLRDEGTDKMYDKKINNLCMIFIQKTIEKILKKSTSEFPNLYDDWYEIICKITTDVIEHVSPSFKDLKDSVDINDYVKIKIIDYNDKSLSRVIDGFAMQKNVCTKKMRIIIDNPRILLLDCGLEGKRNDTVQMPNILTQEPAYLKIIKKKIEYVNPQVILINKNVSHPFLEDMNSSKMNISLVTNVKISSLNKIARCTKTFVLPSADLIGKQTILGQCSQFRIEKIKPVTNNKNPNEIKESCRTNEYNLMIFEGCGKMLYSTIILSGPYQKELKELKRLLKEEILITARDLFLQKYFLYYFNVDIFQVHESLQEYQILSKSEKDFSYGFDTQLLTKADNHFEMVTLSMLNGIKGEVIPMSSSWVITGNPSSYNNSPTQSIAPSECDINPNESAILKSVYSICGQGMELSMSFYSNNFDEEKPLGKLIIDLCQEREEKCKICQRTLNNHSSCLYKENGRIMITLLNNYDYQMDKILFYLSSQNSIELNYQGNGINSGTSDNNADIYSYGYCNICQEIVTPLILLPTELYNFSGCKFFKHVLFNHHIKNFHTSREYNISDLMTCNCDHYLYKDISRIFFSKTGGAIKFSFDPIKHYVFKSPKQIENITILPESSEEALKKSLIAAKCYSIEILEMLKTQFNKYKEDIENIYKDTHISIVRTQIEKAQEFNDKISTIITVLFQLIIKFFTLQFDMELKANVSIKQIYKMIVQVKYIYNKLSIIIRKIKIICFLEKMREEYNNGPKTSGKDATMIDEFNLKNEEFKNEQEPLFNIDNSTEYQALIDIVKFDDDKHMTYFPEVKETNIGSLISYLLTSDEYLEKIIINKIKLDEIKRLLLIAIKNDSSGEDDLYHTSLLYDINRFGFTFPGITQEKVRQQLEICLLSDDKNHFTMNIHFNLLDIIEASFEESKAKTESNSILCKLNTIEVVNSLKEINKEIDLTLLELKAIKETYSEFKSKFKFDKLKFIEEASKEVEANIIAYFPKHFEAMRILYCSTYEDFVLSIAQCNDWNDCSGGKSKANFMRSADDKYVIKCVSKLEFQMFIESGCHYFHHINKYLIYKMPSAMAKTLGAYKIKFKGQQNQTIYCIIMENLFYGLDDPNKYQLKSYDLKGSKINRYVSKKNQKPKQVLPDTNFLEDFNGEPLALDRKLYTLFKSAIQNDCLMLSKMTVVDYSLLLILIDEVWDKDKEKTRRKDKEKGMIKIGIIDYFRKYTWDKQLETVGKTIMHKFLSPTIINPNDYKKRFVGKLCSYFIGV